MLTGRGLAATYRRRLPFRRYSRAGTDPIVLRLGRLVEPACLGHLSQARET